MWLFEKNNKLDKTPDNWFLKRENSQIINTRKEREDITRQQTLEGQ